MGKKGGRGERGGGGGGGGHDHWVSSSPPTELSRQPSWLGYITGKAKQCNTTTRCLTCTVHVHVGDLMKLMLHVQLILRLKCCQTL